VTSVVVDTDVASFVFKNHVLAPAYVDILVGKHLSISFMTLAELRAGAAKASWGVRRTELLERYLSQFEVLHTSDELCAAWADLRAKMEADGRRIESADAWIAATARWLQRPLVTHNRRHFDDIHNLVVISV
jgi:tRNA(fMet)-specific endonuclease VapC